NSDTEKSAPVWSPDGKSLAYTTRDHKLNLVDVASGRTRTLAECEVAEIQTPQFSPDGKWISFTKVDSNLRPHVHFVPSAGGTSVRLPDTDLFASSSAQWTSDGKRLIFLGGYTGPSAFHENRRQLFSVVLTREDRDPMSRDIDDEVAAEAAEKATRLTAP